MGWLLAALGPSVIGWSLSGTANAADEAEVNALLQDAWTVSQDDLVVCAAGDEAAAVARRLLKEADLSPPPALERIAVLGQVETEAERARTKGGFGCAVWIRPSDEEDGQWTAGQVGPCEPPAQSTVPVLAVVPSLDADPGATPPSPTPAPTAPQPEANGPWKLVMADLNPNPADVDGVDWHIVDERGVSWSTYRFAETVGDVDMVGSLDRELSVAAKERKALFWGGIGALAISPLPLAFASTGTYERNQDLAWTSLFLAATGGMTFAIHKRGVQSTKRRQLRPAHYYSRADSEALIGAHNIRVDLTREAAIAAPVETEDAPLQPATPGENAATVVTPEAPESGDAPPASDIAPKEEAPEADAVVPDAPNEDDLEEDAPSEDAPNEDAPSEDAPSEDDLEEDAPSEDAPEEGAPSATPLPVDGAPAEDLPAVEEPTEVVPPEEGSTEAAPPNGESSGVPESGEASSSPSVGGPPAGEAPDAPPAEETPTAAPEPTPPPPAAVEEPEADATGGGDQ